MTGQGRDNALDHIIHNFLAIQFPLLHPSPPVVPPQQSSPPRQSKLSARQP